jgi:hypothetical protein
MVFFLILALLVGVIVSPSRISFENLSPFLKDSSENAIQYKIEIPGKTIQLIAKGSMKTTLKTKNK